MNKITKLLSVLVITGAVGAGAAALAGCSSDDTPPDDTTTIHGTKTEAKAATCLENGNIEYYTSDEEGYEGKYYSDEACTQEITGSVVIAAQGHHDFVYTDNENGTHTITCEHGDYKAVTEAHTLTYTDNGDGTHTVACEHGEYTETVAHVDVKDNVSSEDGSDALCDVCGAKFFTTGKYYNVDYNFEVTVNADGTVDYLSTNYVLSAISDDGSATFTANGTEYTLTKTATGYSVSYDFYGTQLTRELVPTPEEYVSELSEFAGVYTTEGNLIYSVDGYDYATDTSYMSYYKVTAFEISENGTVVYTYVQVDHEDGTTDEGNSYTSVTDVATGSGLKYNKFTASSFTVTALSDGAATIEVVYRGQETGVTFVKDATAAAPVVPTTLTALADNGDKYISSDGAYLLKNQYGYYVLNNVSVYLVKEETVDGNTVVLIKTYDSNYDAINYKLTFVTTDDVTTITLSALDGTEIATLSLKPKAVTPNLVSDGDTANKAECEDDYGFFNITQTGWYTFTTTESGLSIYTEVIDGNPTTWGTGVISFSSALTAEPVYLTAGQVIAANKPYSDTYTYEFTAVYSETEPEPDYTELTGSSYAIESYNAALKYYLKGTASALGKYYVSVVPSTYYADRGVYFEINGTKYGYVYDSSTWLWSEAAGGLVYSETLAEDDEVKIKIGCDNTYLSLGTVTVYFETEAEYNARIAAESTPPTFTDEQKGTYVGSYYLYGDSTSVELIVSDNGITFNDAAMTFVKVAGSSYVYTYGDNSTALVTFNANGSLSFKDSASYIDFTAYKEVEFGGFTAEQQGKYEATVKDNWGSYDVTITVTEDSVSYSVDYDGYLDTTNLLLTSIKDGVYVWRDSNGYTITFSFNDDGNIEVSEEGIYGFEPFTATKSNGTGDDGGDEDEVIYGKD